jgi:hypothetical protein
MDKFLDLVNKCSSLHDKLYGKKSSRTIPAYVPEEHGFWTLENSNFHNGDVHLQTPHPMTINSVLSEIKIPCTELRRTPSPTSSLHTQYPEPSSSLMQKNEEPDTHTNDKLQVVKHFLTKWYPFILDVTELRDIVIWGVSKKIVEIHITVSPTHSVELMTPKIERRVRETIMKKLVPLLSSLFSDCDNDRPQIIFSPTYSETILELI